jgi:hypothetical protein
MSDIKRITFSLTDRSRRALSLAQEIGGDNQTDTVNRALQYYAYLLYLLETEEAVIEAKRPDGTVETISLML